MKTLRWILFIPVSFLGASLLEAFARLISPSSFSFIDNIFQYPIFTAFFVYLSYKIIPINGINKIKIPLIISVVLLSISVLGLVVILKDEFTSTYIFRFLGAVFSLLYSIYLLCSEEKMCDMFKDANYE